MGEGGGGGGGGGGISNVSVYVVFVPPPSPPLLKGLCLSHLPKVVGNEYDPPFAQHSAEDPDSARCTERAEEGETGGCGVEAWGTWKGRETVAAGGFC